MATLMMVTEAAELLGGSRKGGIVPFFFFAGAAAAFLDLRDFTSLGMVKGVVVCQLIRISKSVARIECN